jgi:hypothetical protein
MIKSNSNKNGKEFYLHDENKSAKKERDENKNCKTISIRTKQNSKIICTKEKSLKTTFMTNRIRKEHLGISTNPNVSHLVSTPTTQKKMPVKKDKLIKSVPNFSKKINFRKCIKEDDHTSDELLITTPNTTTNAKSNKKLSWYERKVSFGSFKDKVKFIIIIRLPLLK